MNVWTFLYQCLKSVRVPAVYEVGSTDLQVGRMRCKVHAA